MSSHSPKVLLTGATGYIGGSVLTALLSATAPALENLTITLLLRGQDRADKYLSQYGDRVKPVLFESMDDLDRTVEIAAQHDIVINTTNGYHDKSAAALVEGLAKTNNSRSSAPWLIHTSGVSNISDRPISAPEPIHEWDDSRDDLYSREKSLQAKEPWGQRTAELAVIDAGLEMGVRTLVITSPIIFGKGTGLYNKVGASMVFLRAFTTVGKGLVIGEGKALGDHVHIEDLANLYVLILRELLENDGERVPSGKKGIIFSGNGRHTRLEQTQLSVNAAAKHGLITDTAISHVGLDEAAEQLGQALGMDVKKDMDSAKSFVEVVFASNSHGASNVARGLGWKPTKGAEAWQEHDDEDAEVIKEERSKKA